MMAIVGMTVATIPNARAAAPRVPEVERDPPYREQRHGHDDQRQGFSGEQCSEHDL